MGSREENCSGNYLILGQSSLIEPSNFNEPTQIHLSFADRIDQMFVSYVTNSNESLCQCQYGFNRDSLDHQINGISDKYQSSDMCEGKANQIGPQTFIDPGFIHKILLENLLPSTIYYYRVGNDFDGWSSIDSFRTRSNQSDVQVDLIAYGDMGVSPIQTGAKTTIDQVYSRALSVNASAILHIGDLSYAQGIAILWEAFMNQIQQTARRFPYLVSIGNHEYDHLTGGDKDPSKAPGQEDLDPFGKKSKTSEIFFSRTNSFLRRGNYGEDSGGECAVPTVHRFQSPSNGNLLFWYSYDVGPIHVISYSTEHDFRRESVQYRWIEKDLQSVDRQRTPWILIVSHRPMYSSLVQVDLIQLMLQFHLEPLFYRYHVDLNFFAHIHSYERTCPMYQQRCIQNGIIHILIGMSGHDLTYGSYSDAQWSIYHDIQFGYSHLSANKTHLNFRYYHSYANQTDPPADQFQLQKEISLKKDLFSCESN